MPFEGKSGRRRKTRTPEQEAMIRAFAVDRKLPWKVLCFPLGVCWDTLSRWRWEMGLVTGSRPGVQLHTQAQRDAITRFAAARPRRQWRFLAQELNVSSHTLIRWRRRLGVQTGDRPTKFTPEVAGRIREFSESGRPWKELQAELEVAKMTITRWRREMGLVNDR